ncbi:hypothetical protein Tco_1266159 [Tanacetum coccineum]
MSSPIHPTSNIEDAFSSNFPDYIPASSEHSQLHLKNFFLAHQITHEFFLPVELLPLKKRGRDRSSSSTSTLPQAFEIGEISPHRRQKKRTQEKAGDHQQDFDNLEVELQKAHAQITKLQRKQIGNNNKIVMARFRIANLEQIIEEIQVRHQADKESLLNAIYELKNSQEGPSDY